MSDEPAHLNLAPDGASQPDPGEIIGPVPPEEAVGAEETPESAPPTEEAVGTDSTVHAAQRQGLGTVLSVPADQEQGLGTVSSVPADPVWSYVDLALFLVMAIPCMFVGGLIALQMVKVAVAIFHIHARIPAMAPLAEQVGGDAILFAVLAMILRLEYERPFWRSLGWLPVRIPFLQVVICGLGCALGVALLGSLIRIPTTSNPMVELMNDRPSAILMAFFGVTIAPLTEELVFRGFVQPLLVRSLGAIPGILLAAIPFGLLHYHEYGNSWRHAVLIGLAGAGFGWMRHSTGSTQASTLMHASYNALIFVAVL